MTISITSSTDSPEAVTAAMGDLAQPKASEGKEASQTPSDTEAEVLADKAGAETEAEHEEPETTEDSHEELEAKDETDQDESLEPKAKKKGGFQKRIDKLNTKLSAKDQEIEYWRQEALRVQSGKGPAKETEAAALKTAPSDKPKADDFATAEEFQEALTDWKVKEILAAIDREKTEKAAKTEYQTRIEKHLERVDSFKSAHDDFDDVIESVNGIKMPIAVRETIVESDHGPELMYELSKNPKELERICRLTPLAAAREIGRIESKLVKATDSSETKAKTKVSQPVSPVRTRGTSATKSLYDAEQMSQREFEKLRTEQLKSARG